VWSAVTSPLGVAWTVAIVLTAGLAALLVSSPTTAPVSRPSAGRDGQHVNEEDPARHRELGDADEPPPDIVPSRLKGLFHQLSSYRLHAGSFPPGASGDAALPDAARWSWLAALAAQSDPDGPQPHWDRPWNDPLNDRFVRQRQEAFLNPRIAREIGNDRYPASHYVGVTGVGRDSAELPPDHPRAGMFGLGRNTPSDDVPDGLANTMLVAGVEKDLGSWAVAGPSTLRGFTTEPYVDGPDGFGTGHADGMAVLMADGSVRFLSAATDPAVIRQLAAKDDALPADAATLDGPAMTDIGEKPDVRDAPAEANEDGPNAESRPGAAASPFEPNALPPEAMDVIKEIAGGMEMPIEVPLVEEPAAVDISARFTQPIAHFDQSTPVAARRVLRTLEEMAATEFEYDGLPKDVLPRLDQVVSLTLTETTVGEILGEVLKQLGLSYEIERGRVILRAESKAD
jgi:hypothetical protein